MGLGVGGYSLYNYQQLVSQVERPKSLARAFLATGYYTLSGEWFNVDFDVLDYDVRGDFDITTDRFTCPTSGYYLISGMVTFSSMQDGERIGVRALSESGFEAGSVAHASHTNNLSTGFTDIVFLNAGDYLELVAFFTGAGSIYGDSSGKYTYFTIAAMDF